MTKVMVDNPTPPVLTRVMSVRLTDDLFKQIEQAAAIEDMDPSVFVREASVAQSYKVITDHRKKQAANG